LLFVIKFCAFVTSIYDMNMSSRSVSVKLYCSLLHCVEVFWDSDSSGNKTASSAHHHFTINQTNGYSRNSY